MAHRRNFSSLLLVQYSKERSFKMWCFVLCPICVNFSGHILILELQNPAQKNTGTSYTFRLFTTLNNLFQFLIWCHHRNWICYLIQLIHYFAEWKHPFQTNATNVWQHVESSKNLYMVDFLPAMQAEHCYETLINLTKSHRSNVRSSWKYFGNLTPLSMGAMGTISQMIIKTESNDFVILTSKRDWMLHLKSMLFSTTLLISIRSKTKASVHGVNKRQKRQFEMTWKNFKIKDNDPANNGRQLLADVQMFNSQYIW